jgi:hypothetical protein
MTRVACRLPLSSLAAARDDARNGQRPNPSAMLREFKDGSGKTWRVWDVYPSVQRGKPPSTADDPSQLAPFPNPELSDGWLCFECGSEKRRLTPIPNGWELCGPKALEEYCTRAGYVTQADSSQIRKQPRT